MSAPLALIEDGPAGSTRVVSLRGEIDVGTTPALRDWLSRASEGGRQALVVDLSNVEFMAVSGVYVLCDEQARMAVNRARMTIVCDNARIRQLFDICRLSDVLLVIPTREASTDGAWSGADEERARRLHAWLRRYAVGAPAPSPAPS